jgi:hypothetical protein
MFSDLVETGLRVRSQLALRKKTVEGDAWADSLINAGGIAGPQKVCKTYPNPRAITTNRRTLCRVCRSSLCTGLRWLVRTPRSPLIRRKEERLFFTRPPDAPLKLLRTKPAHDFVRIFIWREDRVKDVANFGRRR